jgi:hypothetical protein
MTFDKDDRKRPQLRLVVNNPDKATAHRHTDDVFIPLHELAAMRDSMRPDFYRSLDQRQSTIYAALERFMIARGWQFGLDHQHGPLMVLPADAVCPEAGHGEGEQQDEIIVYAAEDATGEGLCLSLEMILPFYSEDESVMEDALLFSPVFQYGALFLEENRQDQFLDLIYRIGFPVYPPAPTSRVLARLFTIVAFELKEALQSLAEYAEGQ